LVSQILNNHLVSLDLIGHDVEISKMNREKGEKNTNFRLD